MALTIEGLCKTYPNGVQALKNVSLTIGNNMFGLLGPNGAGKSSLMRTIATLQVPFGPMVVGDAEPIEALLDHLAGIGALAAVLVRGGAHSIGVVRDGVVLSSSTDRAYLQGRTAAGGWSQQRFARRRDNQRTASLGSAAGTAARILTPIAGELTGPAAVRPDGTAAVSATLPQAWHSPHRPTHLPVSHPHSEQR